VNEWLGEWKGGMQIEYLGDEERERNISQNNCGG
jgi:hypothetical protein